MASILSFRSLLDSDMLMGSNSDSQYQKLNNVLKSYQAKKPEADQSQAEASLDSNRLRKRNKQSVADQDAYMIIPCNFSVCDTFIWVLDNESLIHICNSL